MRFYKLTYATHEDHEPRSVVEWYSSERLALNRRMELFKSGKLAGRRLDQKIEIHNIGPLKEQMLIWLRKHCT